MENASTANLADFPRARYLEFDFRQINRELELDNNEARGKWTKEIKPGSPSSKRQQFAKGIRERKSRLQLSRINSLFTFSLVVLLN